MCLNRQLVGSQLTKPQVQTSGADWRTTDRPRIHLIHPSSSGLQISRPLIDTSLLPLSTTTASTICWPSHVNPAWSLPSSITLARFMHGFGLLVALEASSATLLCTIHVRHHRSRSVRILPLLTNQTRLLGHVFVSNDQVLTSFSHACSGHHQVHRSVGEKHLETCPSCDSCTDKVGNMSDICFAPVSLHFRFRFFSSFPFLPIPSTRCVQHIAPIHSFSNPSQASP